MGGWDGALGGREEGAEGVEGDDAPEEGIGMLFGGRAGDLTEGFGYVEGMKRL